MDAGSQTVARSRSGQASAELLAAIPAVVFVVLLLGQLALAGHAAWSAANAARAGARVAHVGGDAKAAALAALPEYLRGEAEIRDEGAVEVEVRAPALVPVAPSIPLTASASLNPAAEPGASR